MSLVTLNKAGYYFKARLDEVLSFYFQCPRFFFFGYIYINAIQPLGFKTSYFLSHLSLSRCSN